MWGCVGTHAIQFSSATGLKNAGRDGGGVGVGGRRGDGEQRGREHEQEGRSAHGVRQLRMKRPLMAVGRAWATWLMAAAQAFDLVHVDL